LQPLQVPVVVSQNGVAELVSQSSSLRQATHLPVCVLQRKPAPHESA
jgi:hypothetical protein